MFRLGARRPLASEQLFAFGFGLLEVMNIGRGPDPLHDLSPRVADRTPARQVPAELAVLSAEAGLALDNLLFGIFPRSDVVMRDDGPAALATQRRYRHQKPALLAWRVAGIFNCEIGAHAVQHRLNARQRRLYLAITLLLSAAADVQVIDAHTVGNGRAVVFSRETSPVFVDGDDVSVPVEHGDVGRKRVEYGLVERLALAQRRLCAFALSDVGCDAANGVWPPPLVA